MTKNISLVGCCDKHGQIKTNGQTVKVRQVHSLLESISGVTVSVTDTVHPKRRLPVILWKLLTTIAGSDCVVILPAANGLRYLFPIVYFLSRVLKKPLIYVVIGGWLPSFLSERPFLKNAVGRIRSVMVELPSMKKRLEEMGMTNVVVVPNFKLDIEPSSFRPVGMNGSPKGIFLSRVVREKGVFLLLEALKELTEEGISVVFDFYGPISGEEEAFLNAVNKIPGVQYQGVVAPNEVQTLIRAYDYMVFPTFYPGEGFPGAFLDALYGNVPVLASDWRYNTEILTGGVDSLIFKTGRKQDLKEALRTILSNRDELNRLKRNIPATLDRFRMERVREIFASQLNG